MSSGRGGGGGDVTGESNLCGTEDVGVVTVGAAEVGAVGGAFDLGNMSASKYLALAVICWMRSLMDS